MRRYIETRSDIAEFIFVFVFAFGYFLFGSFSSLLHPISESIINQRGLVCILVYEVFAFGLVWPILSIRNWSFNGIGLKPSIKDTFIGFIIYILMVILYVVPVLIVITIFAPLRNVFENTRIVDPNINILLIIFVSVINPIFEEIFVCAYVIEKIKKHKGLAAGIMVSVLIRTLYHLYQGLAGMFLIVPMGIIFALWYGKTKRLWPLIVTHGVMDLVGLLVSQI